MSTTQEGLHPINPGLVGRLNPAFIDVYNTHMINIPLTNRVPVADIRRNVTSFNRFPGGRAPIPVAEIREVVIPGVSGPLKAKIYIPKRKDAEKQSALPILVFYTHGGFVVCGLNVDDSFCTRMAQGAQCIVVSAEYAKSPENPFPAAIDDSWAVLQWAHASAEQFNGNPSQIGVAGIDAGANIAAVMSHMVAKSKSRSISLKFQLLIVPFVDATACLGDERYPSWTEFEYAPCLPVEKQLWNRLQYLGPSPSSELLHDWRVSPIFATEWKGLPPAFIAVAEIDILRDEGDAYAARLRKEGIAVEYMKVSGVGHPMSNMDEAIQECRELVEASISATGRALRS